MVIRPAALKDAPRIAELASQLGYPLDPSLTTAVQGPLLRHPDHGVFVAEDDDGNVTGWIHAFISRRLFVPPFAELGGIVVDSSRRRTSIGSALLTKAEEWASQVGCPLFRIRSNTRRAEAAPFYSRRGYTQSKTQNIFEKSLVMDRHA